MKSKAKLYLPMLLALALIALVLAVVSGREACRPTDGTVVAELASAESVTLIAPDSQSTYTVIFAASDQEVADNDFANRLRNEIFLRIGAQINVAIDAITGESQKEILVGLTNRTASESLMQTVNAFSEDGKYLVAAVSFNDGKLAFISSHAEGYTYYEDIMLSLITEDGLVLKEGYFDIEKVLYEDYLAEMKAKEEAEKEAAKQKKYQTLLEMQSAFTQDQFGVYKPMIGEDGYYVKNPYDDPWYYPTVGDHPRILLNRGDVATVKALLENPEYKDLAENFWKVADADISFGILSDTKGNSGEYYRWNAGVLGAITCKAMAYLITGDEVYGLEAIVGIKNYMLTYKYTADIHSDIYHGGSEVLFVTSLVFDWCHGMITEDDVNHFLAGIPNLCISTMEINYPPTNMGSVSGHGTGPQFLRDMMTMATAFADEAPDWWELIAGRYFQQYLPVANESYAQGWVSQGTANYAYNKMNVMLWAAMNVYTATGEIVLLDGANESMYFLISHTIPSTGKYFETGDGSRSADGANRSWEYTAFFIAAALYKDPGTFANAKAMSENFSDYTNNSVSMMTPAMQLACISVYLRASDDTGQWRYEGVDLVQYFDAPAGQMTARNSWSRDDAVAVLMKIGNKTMANHDNLDHGTFQIYYKGLLACSSGAYAKYGGNVHKYYLQATVSANGLLIFNPAFADEEPVYGKKADGSEDKDNITNAARYFYSGGQDRRSEAGSYAVWNNGRYDMGETMGAATGYYEDGAAEYGYLAGDITKSYSSETVKHVSRRMLTVFTLDEEFPMVFYVYDIMTSTDPSFKKTFLLHTIKEPEVNEQDKTAAVVEGDGKMYVHSVFGADSIEKIGGSGYAYWINGKNCVDQYKTSDSASTIWGRIELNTAGEEKSNMLTLMYVTDADTEGMLEVGSFESESVHGAIVGNTVTVFTKSEQLAYKEFSFAAEGRGLYKYYVSGVEAGTWNVSVDGRTVAHAYASEGEGFISFVAPTGAVTITPGADVIGANGGKIQYNTLGGTLPEGTPYIYNNEVVTPLPTEVYKENSTFLGWYTSPNYEPETKVTEIPIGTEGLFRVYAKYLNIYINEDFEDQKIEIIESHKNINGVYMSADGKTGASYTTYTDEDGESYLLWIKGTKDPSLSFTYGSTNLAQTSPDDMCISYEFKLSRDGENPVIPTTIRLIAGKDVNGATLSPTLKIELFSIKTSGDIVFNKKNIATLTDGVITNLRFVLDFEKCECRVYADDYSVIASAPIQIPEGTGAKNGAELKKCITNQLIHFYAQSKQTGAEALRVYGIRIEDNDVFTSRYVPIENKIDYVLGGGVLPDDAPISYSTTEPTVLPIPEKANNIFAGWYTSESFETGTLVTELPAMDVGDFAVYARWYRVLADEDYTTNVVDVDASANKSVGAMLYSANGKEGSTYKTKTDEKGIGYLEWIKGLSDPALSIVGTGDNLTNSAASEISFTLTVAKDGDMPVSDMLVNIIANRTASGTSLSSSAKILMLQLKNGKILLAGKTEIGEVTLAPTTVRFVIDFDALTVTAYDARGNILASEAFAIPEKTEAANGRELMTCINQRIIHFHASKSSEDRSIRFYRFRAAEGNEFVTPITNPIDYHLDGGTLPEDAPISYDNEIATKLPSEPTLNNAVFAGWYTSADFAEDSLVTEVPTDTVGAFAVYAKWLKTLAHEDYSKTVVSIENTNGSRNGISYSANSNPSVSYLTKTDNEGNKYLEWNKGTGDPSMSITNGSNNLTNIASDEVSYLIRISKTETNLAPKLLVRLVANHDVNGTKFSSTPKITVLESSSDGQTLKLGAKTAIATLSADQITTLRIVIDFGNLELRAYDENGDVIARETFTIPSETGAQNGKELMKCFTQTSLHFYAYKNSSSDTEPRVLNVYELYVVEGDIFAK